MAEKGPLFGRFGIFQTKPTQHYTFADNAFVELVQHFGSEVDKGEKDNIKFIIAGENAAKASDTPKQPLDLIALLVQLLIIVPGIFPVLLRWNNRHIPKRQSQGSRFVTFISPIHQQMNRTGNRTEPP